MIKHIDPTKWTATDGLGRTLECSNSISDTGIKKEKLVGMCYWTWHDQAHLTNRPININNLIKAHPELQNDFNNPIWKDYEGFNFWNEPLFGYYARPDKYVLRKHAEMLANAGVDFVLFDCTNGDFVWESAYMALLEVWDQAQKEGVNVPKIAFMLQFVYTRHTLSALNKIYTQLYKPGLYKDLWFCMDGKPMVMAHNNGLNENDPVQKELKDFFTFKAGEPSYFNGDKDNSEWGWLHIYPQAAYYKKDGTVEMTTVGVAQNADYKDMRLCAMNGPANMGRSYTIQEEYSYTYNYGGENIVVNRNTPDCVCYGLNFQEQWDYAISLDPDIIFVTGWNEWNMGRFEEWCEIKNAFPDQFDDENSRDIEPVQGILKDHYYYQLVNNVRRFKGVNKQEAQTSYKTIDISKGKEQWEDPNIISYAYYAGNTPARDDDGFVGCHYVNEEGRNEIILAKVACDENNVYFYAETAKTITSEKDPDWMRLLIDTQPSGPNGADWEGFEYIINKDTPDGMNTKVFRSKGGWNWEEVGQATYTVYENILQISVPREVLGLTEKVAFSFKWCDANLTDGDIMSLYTHGSCTPGGRFAFSFSCEKI